MDIRLATPADHERIMQIYRIAQDYMIASGNPNQWGHAYPEAELVKYDIAMKVCRVLYDEEGLHGVFALLKDPEPTYTFIEGGKWLNDEPYITVHRVASDGKRHGIVRCVMDYAKSLSDNVRVDTHEQNLTMQKQREKHSFKRCGIIYLKNGASRIAYQWTRENSL